MSQVPMPLTDNMVAGCPPHPTVNLRERSPMRLGTPLMRGRILTATLLAAYIVVVAVVVLWPTPVDAAANGLIRQVLSALHRAGIPDWFDYNLIESGANVVMFIPLGLLTALLLPSALRWLTPAGALVFSGAIEWCQQAFLPGRYASLQDVWVNTLGAAVGTVLAYAWLEHLRNRRPVTR
ncbi:VanZ family protein [Arthrobacter sp. NPDC089319]|uniref:VanZ family protein n=1 Tax=Arthrobacter sp. NPDC089319 TaxID=3155915 RepID=UPI00343BC796